MSFCDYLIPVQDLYYGFFPDAPNPLHYKWNYKSEFVVEREQSSCNECFLEKTLGVPTRIPPPIGEYHANNTRFSSGTMLTFHRPQPCSKALGEQIEQLDYEAHLDKYGLHWEIPWRSNKKQYLYVRAVPSLSVHELDPTLQSAWTTDKVNSSMLMTDKGPIRFAAAFYDQMGRPKQ